MAQSQVEPVTVEVHPEEPPLLPNPEELENELDHLQEEATEEQVPEEAPQEAPTGEQLPVQEKPKEVAGLEASLDAAVFREFLKQLDVVMDEVKVIAGRDGWHVRTVDPAHVAMIDLSLPFDSFSSNRIYWVQPPEGGGDLPETLEFGIDVEKLLEVVKRAKGTVWFRYRAERDAGSIEVQMGSETRSTYAVDTAGMSDLRDINVNLPMAFEIPGKDLLEAVQACEAVSDHVIIEAGPGDTGEALKVVVSAEGDVDKYRREFTEEVKADKVDGQKYRSLFPLDYLLSILKVVRKEGLVIRMSTDYPLEMRWSGSVVGKYALAPRIEAD